MTKLPNGEYVLGKDLTRLPGREETVSFATQQELTDFYTQVDKVCVNRENDKDSKRSSNLIQFGSNGMPN